ncbi:helix-turn-helix domain-containing protein [Faecalibacterium prausnitzii]|uniref:helix-turn-helix domain-containing protein n=1 Tax=Faecalibacterium prausnitzii TaxID=853 RepID=UPI003F1C496D
MYIPTSKTEKETHEEPPLKLQCPKNGKYYSFQEIQAFYGISRPTLDSWVLKEGIPTMKLGRVKRIQKDAFDEVLKSKRKVEEDVQWLALSNAITDTALSIPTNTLMER